MKKKSFVFITVIFFLIPACGLWAAGKGEAAGSPGSDWPKRTVQMVVPFSPGGDCDFNARAYATRIGEVLGQTVVVTNVNGNNGAVGATQVKNTAPDGYTLLFSHTNLFVQRAVGSIDYGLDAFEIACIGAKDAGYAVVVNSKSPYKTLKDLIEASQKSPGKISFAAGAGGTTFVMGTLLNIAGAKLNLADFGGAAERTAGLLGGHIDAIPNPLGSAVPYIKSGDWRALAVLGNERNAMYEDVPTAIEQGYNVEFSIYYFAAFPKNTPKEIVEKFGIACKKVYELEDYRSSIMNTYQQKPLFLSGQEAINLLSKQEKEILGMKSMF
jgi:tripartite-type tricarboxylate transporter receptor subunit TctC